MATSINIDLSNIGDKVAAAIQESMEKMVNEKVAAATKDIKKEGDEPSIAGVREQILANSTWLFPVLLKRSPWGADQTPDVNRAQLSVITMGEGNTISARVLYKLAGNETSYILLQGPYAPNQTEALRKLLGDSSMLFEKRYQGDVFKKQSADGKQVASGGWYYTTNE